MNKIPRVLVIAGSDSGGGAGIQADLKTLNAIGVFGMSAVTSLTAQNTVGVDEIHDVPPEFVRKEIMVCLEDIGANAVKTGMLSNKEIIHIVAEEIKRAKIPYFVLDPVMKSQSGSNLIRGDAKETLIKELLPLATVITPNRMEAEEISGISIENLTYVESALKRIKELGSKYVIIKGGHFVKEKSVDFLFDGNEIHKFESDRVETKNTHGSGCTFASAIAGYLVKGESIISAVSKAKDFVTGAIKHGLPIGKGYGPVNHFWNVND